MGPMGIVILVGALYPLLILIWLKHVSRVFFFQSFLGGLDGQRCSQHLQPRSFSQLAPESHGWLENKSAFPIGSNGNFSGAKS